MAVLRSTSLSILLMLGFLAVPVFGAAPPAPSARSVDEIVRRHVDAIGGKAQWAKVHSLLIKGSGPYAMTTWIWKEPGKVRTEERDAEGSGHAVITASDGTHAWVSNTFRGPATPRPLAPEELRRWQTGLAIRSDLLDLPAKGAALTLLGEEKVNGKDAYKLSLKRDDRDEVLLWIDTRTFLLVQRARTTTAPWGGTTTVATPLTDYRRVEGVMIPHAIGETLLIVEVNPEIADAAFQPEPSLK
jgi:outer membrane lipoprotein-sorting protein